MAKIEDLFLEMNNILATIKLSDQDALTLKNCLDYCKHRLSEKHHKDIGLQKAGCTLEMVERLIEKWFPDKRKIGTITKEIFEEHFREDKTIREKIAKVIGDELPWPEEDLLEFADKIIAVVDVNKTKDKEPNWNGSAVNIDYNCTLSKMAEQIGIKLWQAMAMMKYKAKDVDTEKPIPNANADGLDYLREAHKITTPTVTKEPKDKIEPLKGNWVNDEQKLRKIEDKVNEICTRLNSLEGK